MIKSGDCAGVRSAGGPRVDDPGEIGISEVSGAAVFFCQSRLLAR